MADSKFPYSTHLDTRYPALTVIDVPELVRACTDSWYNQTLCSVNGSVVRLGIVQGEYHWHRHEAEDEFFLVLEGGLTIELEDMKVELGKLQGFVVPRGIVHRTSAAGRTVMLMVENASIVPTGDGD